MKNNNINYINKDAFLNNSKENGRFKLAVAALATSVVILGSVAIDNYFQNKSIPEGYEVAEKTIDINCGITVDYIVEQNYTDDISKVYPTKEEYKKMITEKNRNIIQDNIIWSDNILVPFLINKENPHYIRIQEIKEEINTIEKENYWVIAIPNKEDTIFKYALSASSNNEEALILAEQIAAKNNIHHTNSGITVGKGFWVINPKLGELKVELKQLYEDLVNNNQDKHNLTKKKNDV